MHSLRVLKKLSKRAAPLLPLLGDDRKQFPAERGENYTGVIVLGRKHWERGRSVHADLSGDYEIKTPRRHGPGYIWMRHPSHPRKGTVMVGAMEGYYEPEWSEETAWESMCELLDWHFAVINDDGEPEWSPRLRTPSDYFQAAAEVIRAGTTINR